MNPTTLSLSLSLSSYGLILGQTKRFNLDMATGLEEKETLNSNQLNSA